MEKTHEGFVTVGMRPFRRDSFPMRLFQKAKRLGIWNPSDIDLARDRETWRAADEEIRDGILGTLAAFQAGEEAVTLDLLPLIQAVALEGRIEEEMYLTSFLFEEAKHVEFFQRWLHEVAEIGEQDLSFYLTPSYRTLFYDRLPRALHRLGADPSPKNQLIASVTYNMVIEGVLAETGYFGFYDQLENLGGDFFPGLMEGIGKLKQDESRHIAYGIFLISRILAANPELWSVAAAEMADLMGLAMRFVTERMQYQIQKYGRLPYDQDPQKIMTYAGGQYQKRLQRLDRARQQSLAEVEQAAIAIDLDA